jgi:DNA-binding transcriptional regulator YhcF (GntR family)
VDLRLDPSSPVPLSAQLREAIASRVARGRLLPGDRLPPVRELAAELGLATNTVARAYRELEAAGLLVGRGRLGTFVADRLPEAPSDVEVRLAEAASAYARRARQLGVGPADARRAVEREYRRR